MRIAYRPIGTIHSPFRDVEGVPIQSAAAAGIRGSVEVLPELVEGLQDLGGFSHVVLLYHFHLVRESRLTVTPFLDSYPRGVFATRAPTRPNPIGLSVVKLLGIEGNVLHVENVDIVDGTPLLDIKPYVPEFDHHATERTGWLEQAKGHVQAQKADDRFR
jgi:tRNA-Thr(GGU) m(6)t(6)A37 methyltransferase TsaA